MILKRDRSKGKGKGGGTRRVQDRAARRIPDRMPCRGSGIMKGLPDEADPSCMGGVERSPRDGGMSVVSLRQTVEGWQ